MKNYYMIEVTNMMGVLINYIKFFEEKKKKEILIKYILLKFLKKMGKINN